MNNFERTYKLDKLYHQFLKPQKISLEHLNDFMVELIEFGFINIAVIGKRYSESAKLIEGKNKKELFKILQSFKERPL